MTKYLGGDAPYFWANVEQYYFVMLYENLTSFILTSTIFISVIPTLLYTWHHFDVLSRASNPNSGKIMFYIRFALIVAISGLVVFLPQWSSWSAFQYYTE